MADKLASIVEGTKLHAFCAANGKYHSAVVLTTSSSKKRAKKPVKVSYNGHEKEAWVSLDELKSKKLGLSPKKEEPKTPKARKQARLRRPLRIGTDCSGMETPVMALRKLKVPHEHSFSCDTDPHVKKQIEANFPEAKWFDDLMERDNSASSTPAVDLYVAGFPCQSFSQQGLQNGFKDKNGIVFFRCADYINSKRPRAFVLENVKGLLSNNKGKTFIRIMKDLRGIGDGEYNVDYALLNTKQHGVPQNRERVYIVGIKNSCLQPKKFEFPEALPEVSIEEFLDPLPQPVTFRDLPPPGNTNFRANVERILKELRDDGKEPFRNTYCIDAESSDRRCGKTFDYVMCMTKSRAAGFWVSSRGRRMSIDEMLRLQGMARKAITQVVTNLQLGAQVGNAMSQNVMERILINLLPAAGLVQDDVVLKDRWIRRTKKAKAKATLAQKAAADPDDSPAPKAKAKTSLAKRPASATLGKRPAAAPTDAPKVDEPAPKAKAKAATKKPAANDDESDEDEEAAAPSKAKKRPAATATRSKIKIPKTEAAPVDADRDDDAKAKSKSAPAKEAVPKVDEPAPKAKAKAATKKVAANDDEESDKDEEVPAPSKPKKRNNVGVSKGGQEELTVFVGGIPDSIEEAMLRKDFEAGGEIDTLNFPINDSGKLKGIAFIKYKSKDGVDAALKFNEEEYYGHRLQVNLEVGKSKRKAAKDKGKETVPVPDVEYQKDPYKGVRVKNDIDGTVFYGNVEGIEIGAISKEKVYRIRYDDNHLEHFTLDQLLERKVEEKKKMKRPAAAVPSVEEPVEKSPKRGRKKAAEPVEETPKKAADLEAEVVAKKPAAADEEMEEAQDEDEEAAEEDEDEEEPFQFTDTDGDVITLTRDESTGAIHARVNDGGDVATWLSFERIGKYELSVVGRIPAETIEGTVLAESIPSLLEFLRKSTQDEPPQKRMKCVSDEPLATSDGEDDAPQDTGSAEANTFELPLVSDLNAAPCEEADITKERENEDVSAASTEVVDTVDHSLPIETEPAEPSTNTSGTNYSEEPLLKQSDAAEQLVESSLVSIDPTADEPAPRKRRKGKNATGEPVENARPTGLSLVQMPREAFLPEKPTDSPTPVKQRPVRIRVRPLEAWRNERIEYQRLPGSEGLSAQYVVMHDETASPLQKPRKSNQRSKTEKTSKAKDAVKTGTSGLGRPKKATSRETAKVAHDDELGSQVSEIPDAPLPDTSESALADDPVCQEESAPSTTNAKRAAKKAAVEAVSPTSNAGAKAKCGAKQVAAKVVATSISPTDEIDAKPKRNARKAVVAVVAPPVPPISDAGISSMSRKRQNLTNNSNSKDAVVKKTKRAAGVGVRRHGEIGETATSPVEEDRPSPSSPSVPDSPMRSSMEFTDNNDKKASLPRRSKHSFSSRSEAPYAASSSSAAGLRTTDQASKKKANNRNAGAGTKTTRKSYSPSVSPRRKAHSSPPRIISRHVPVASPARNVVRKRPASCLVDHDASSDEGRDSRAASKKRTKTAESKPLSPRRAFSERASTSSSGIKKVATNATVATGQERQIKSKQGAQLAEPRQPPSRAAVSERATSSDKNTTTSRTAGAGIALDPRRDLQFPRAPVHMPMPRPPNGSAGSRPMGILGMLERSRK